MKTPDAFPTFDDRFSDLNQFILELVRAYGAGSLKSWDELEERVRVFFTPERMEEMESLVSGWQKMASYSEGITLVHVMCVFLGLFMLPEFRGLTPDQQQMAKWIILLHDVDKFHIPGRRDRMHAFRSGSHAANILTALGFPAGPDFHDQIDSWSEYTRQAFIGGEEYSSRVPDNRKLPHILAGIDQLYGTNTPGALIVKAVLLHISPAVDPFYPTPAPLTEDEIKRFISPSLFPLLRAMMLSDNEGWSMFDPDTRSRQRRDTLAAFEGMEKLVF